MVKADGSLSATILAKLVSAAAAKTKTKSSPVYLPDCWRLMRELESMNHSQ
jgi:hypothetical protein